MSPPRSWTDERIERALRELCAGRERFPTQRELKQAGLGGLYAWLYRGGELDAWAARLGVTRNRGAWADEDIQRALEDLCDGLQRFPNPPIAHPAIVADTRPRPMLS
jgi:hypothetical protein